MRTANTFFRIASLAILFAFGLFAACGDYLEGTVPPSTEDGGGSDDGGGGSNESGSSSGGDDGGPLSDDDSSSIGSDVLYAQAVKLDTPVAWWRFDDSATLGKDEFGAHALDSVGGAGPVSAVGRVGGGVNVSTSNFTFNVTTSDLLQFGGKSPFSIELWINQSASSTPPTPARQTLISHYAEGPNEGWRLSVAQNVFFDRAKGTIQGIQSALVSQKEWHHIVAIFNGATLRLFLDGTSLSPGDSTDIDIPSPTSAPLLLGGGAATYLNFNGVIDEVAVYNKALSEARVLAHYNAAP